MPFHQEKLSLPLVHTVRAPPRGRGEGALRHGALRQIVRVRAVLPPNSRQTTLVSIARHDPSSTSVRPLHQKIGVKSDQRSDASRRRHAIVIPSTECTS